ncbi:unnamed protein product [Alopecurus aequalis]
MGCFTVRADPHTAAYPHTHTRSGAIVSLQLPRAAAVDCPRLRPGSPPPSSGPGPRPSTALVSAPVRRPSSRPPPESRLPPPSASSTTSPQAAASPQAPPPRLPKDPPPYGLDGRSHNHSATPTPLPGRRRQPIRRFRGWRRRRRAAGSPARIQPLRGDVDGLLWHIVAVSAGALRCHPPPSMRSGIGSSWTVSTISGSSQVLEVPAGREEGSATLSLEGMRWASTLEGATGTSPSVGSGSNIGGSGLPSEKRPCPQERKGRGTDESASQRREYNDTAATT